MLLGYHSTIILLNLNIVICLLVHQRFRVYCYTEKGSSDFLEIIQHLHPSNPYYQVRIILKLMIKELFSQDVSFNFGISAYIPVDLQFLDFLLRFVSVQDI